MTKLPSQHLCRWEEWNIMSVDVKPSVKQDTKEIK